MEKTKQKFTQVTINFFLKVCQMILQARSLDEASKGKINKWFNLHTFSTDDFRRELRLWKSINELDEIPPMIVETYLDLSELPQGHTLALRDEHGNHWPVTKGGSKKTLVVLERWLVEFSGSEYGTVEDLPYIYKQAIILCRSIYTIIRLMPAASLRDRLSHLTVANKIVDGSKIISLKGRIGLSNTIIPHQMLTESHVRHRSFEPIKTLMGTLKVSVAYRLQCDFSEMKDERMVAKSTEVHARTEHGEIDAREKVEDEHESTQTPTEKHQELTKKFEAETLLAGTYNDPPSNTPPIISPLDVYAPNELAPKDLPFVSGTELGPELRQESGPDSRIDSRHDSRHDTKTETRSDSRPDFKPDPKSDAHFHTPFREYKQFGAVRLESSDLTEGTPPLSLSGSPSSPPRDDRKRPSIQPFRVGSIGSLPPPASSSFERRVSITSNKSTSNASLAAVLRNPRSSFSIPIAGALGTTGAFPRSVSLSHGYGYEDSDSAANTPRFLSSFGSRASRRFSNASARHGSLHDTTSPLGTSAGLGSLLPLSGLYIDDDIGDFVRMIDSKLDLRFGHDSVGLGSQPDLQYDALSKFHLLKSQHQQLGDSVSASVMMLQKSLSPPGSYDPHLPAVRSRLRELLEPEPGSAPAAIIKPAAMVLAPVTSTTSAHAMSQRDTRRGGHEVVGLSTTPLAYRKQPHYENVFDDDDDDDDHGYFKTKARSKSLSRSHFDDDDDLLFTMSDTNLARH